MRLKFFLVEFWRLFWAQTLSEQANLMTRYGWIDFAPETYPQFLGCSSYRFPSLGLKNISVDFWRLPGTESTRARKVEKRAQMTILQPKHTHTVWVRFLSFFVNTADKCLSQILTTFPGLDTTRAGLEQTKLKTGPEWLYFAPKTQPQCLG